jgi:CDP-diacylglycerol--serine O-phosphatidyltransferase
MIITYHALFGVLPPAAAHGPIAAVVGLLALLMVSTVRYRTFKDLRLSKKSALIFMLVVLSGLAIGTQLQPAYVLVAYSSAYLAMGLIESAFLVRKRLVARKVGGTGAVAAAVVLEEEDEEEEEEDDEEEAAGSGDGPYI